MTPVAAASAAATIAPACSRVTTLNAPAALPRAAAAATRSPVRATVMSSLLAPGRRPVRRTAALRAARPGPHEFGRLIRVGPFRGGPGAQRVHQRLIRVDVTLPSSPRRQPDEFAARADRSTGRNAAADDNHIGGRAAVLSPGERAGAG